MSDKKLPDIRKIIIPIFLSLIAALALFLVVAFYYLADFSKKTGHNPQYFLGLAIRAYRQSKQLPPQNFIILGLEKRDDWLEKTETTDTIIFLSLRPQQSQIKMLSIPRDLWLHPIEAKVNQVYPRSLKDQSVDYQYIKDNFSQLTGQIIDHVIILETRNLADLVDIIGGVDVFLEKGFTDKQYPNPEYIANPGPNVPIYITIEFPSGLVHIDKNNLPPFVRSRKGSDSALNGGTDLGRIKRQQLLFEAILDRLTQKQFLLDTQNLANLYNYFHQQIKTTLSDNDIAAIILAVFSRGNLPSISKFELPVGDTPKTGLIYHPEPLYHLQWVFLPSDPTYQQIHHFVSENLND